MLYTELIIGLVKVILYGLFIVIMVRIYTLPLFAVRPMYLTARAFKKAFNDVILSRRAIHNMNTWYPDATPEELENTDNVCIICREEMIASSTKKLPCNHIFHKNCLRSWFQRQQTCPTCRLDVLRAPLPGQQTRRQQQQRPQQQQNQPQPQQPQAAAQQQPPPNVQQVLAQFMAANARLHFPPAAGNQPPTAASSGVSSQGEKIKRFYENLGEGYGCRSPVQSAFFTHFKSKYVDFSRLTQPIKFLQNLVFSLPSSNTNKWLMNRILKELIYLERF